MQHLKRNPVVVLLLSIFTCGIYSYVIIYKISKEVRDFRGDTTIDPGIEVLLSIVTCGLYTIYWYYKYGKLVYEMEVRMGIWGCTDMSLILLLLPIFGFSIVSMILLQSELNRVWDAVSPYQPPVDPDPNTRNTQNTQNMQSGPNDQNGQSNT